MSNFYLRRDVGSKETIGAICTAVGVGIVTFYVTRCLIARDVLEREAPAPDRLGRRAGTTEVSQK